jgi:hypothetical protein
MDQLFESTPRRIPWNKGKLVGQKASLWLRISGRYASACNRPIPGIWDCEIAALKRTLAPCGKLTSMATDPRNRKECTMSLENIRGASSQRFPLLK